jgi:hypothetical protein
MWVKRPSLRLMIGLVSVLHLGTACFVASTGGEKTYAFMEFVRGHSAFSMSLKRAIDPPFL